MVAIHSYGFYHECTRRICVYKKFNLVFYRIRGTLKLGRWGGSGPNIGYTSITGILKRRPPEHRWWELLCKLERGVAGAKENDDEAVSGRTKEMEVKNSIKAVVLDLGIDAQQPSSSLFGKFFMDRSKKSLLEVLRGTN